MIDNLRIFITGVVVIVGIGLIIYFAYKISTSRGIEDYELGEKGEFKKHWRDE